MSGGQTLKKEAGKRENQLQFLRFFAFLNVFIRHAECFVFFNYPSWNGAVSSVTFFIILSSALTGYSACGKSCQLSLKAICKDMWKKISKVFFLHFLTTIFATFFTDLPRLLIDGDFAAAFGPLKQLLVNLLMLQSWFPIAYLNYNGVSWFLSTIMFLYLFNLPLCALLNKIKDSKHRNWIFGTIILLCTALTCGYSYITYSGNIHFMQYIFPPARLGQYIIGMVLGFWLRIAKDSFTSSKSKTVFFTIAEVAVLAFWIASLFLSNESWRNRLVDWIAPNVLLIGVFIMGQGLVSRLFCFKPLVRLGDVSFECYLIHQVVIFAFTRLSNVSPNSNAANLGCIFICLCFTVLLALFLNKAPKNHVPQTAKNASTKS